MDAYLDKRKRESDRRFCQVIVPNSPNLLTPP